MPVSPNLPDWRQVHFQDTQLVDLHAHPSMNVSLFHQAITSRIYDSSRAFDPFSFRTTFPRLKAGGVDALFSVIYPPEKGILEECRLLGLMRYLMPRTWKKIYAQPYFTLTLQLLDEIERVTAVSVDPTTNQPGGRFIRSLSELDDLLKQDKTKRPVGLIHCIEGGHAIEGSLANLDTLFNRGVAYMVLAHFFENEITHPCFPWPENIQKFNCFRGERDITKGLKPFGEQVVERMVELGMLIDVSHCTPPARARVYEIVGKRAPLLATHVGAYAINPDPYNLQDWELRKIAESGGMAGVIFMNYWLMPRESHRGLNFITHTIQHFMNVAGLEHTGIGSDFDGFTDPPDDLKDASELPRLTQRLLAEGLSPDQIAKIMGGNALRVLRDGWGRK